jgi:hypothetical protein
MEGGSLREKGREAVTEGEMEGGTLRERGRDEGNERREGGKEE